MSCPPPFHNYDQGFLSEPFDDVRQAVRDRYPEWRDLLLKVNAECVASQHAIAIHPTDQREVLAAVLFSRVLASTQAAILLLEYGLLSQAKTMVRAALEALFPLGAIYQKPEIVAALIQSHDANRRTVADRVLRWPELKREVEKQIPEDELRQILANKAPGISLFDLAKAADMENWYLGPYTLLSFPAHSALLDLEASHVVASAEGIVEGLRNEPQVDGQTSTWAHAIETLIAAARALEGVFGEIRVDTQEATSALRCLVQRESANG